MNVTHDFAVQRSLRYNIYMQERELFDAQPIGEGYSNAFSHQFDVTWRSSLT